MSEGKDSLVQLIKLCDDPNLVGLKLLENLNTVPLRDLNCSMTCTHARLTYIQENLIKHLYNMQIVTANILENMEIWKIIF